MIRLHGWSRILALSFCAKSGPISIGKISLKKKINLKFKNQVILEFLNCINEKKNSRNGQISVLGVYYVAKI
jgi:hypothetical protein